MFSAPKERQVRPRVYAFREVQVLFGLTLSSL